MNDNNPNLNAKEEPTRLNEHLHTEPKQLAITGSVGNYN